MRPLVTRNSTPGIFREANYYEAGPSVGIYSWCPTPDGSGLPTQVHLHVGSPPGTVMVVRFKGPDSLDAIIDGLLEHREHVWGKR